jgi:hypothetical protein
MKRVSAPLFRARTTIIISTMIMMTLQRNERHALYDA